MSPIASPTPKPSEAEAGPAEHSARARYRAFINQDAAGISEVDFDGRFRLVNQKFCEITGYTEEELLGMRFHEITHPDDLATNVGLLEQLKATGTALNFEKRYVRKDGAVAWVHLSVTRIDPATNEPPSVLAVALDVTDRQRAFAAEREMDRRHRALFESLDVGICVIEMIFDEQGRAADYRFLEVNPAFEQATGLRDVLGSRMRELAPRHEQHWFDIYGRVALTRDRAHFEQEAAALDRWFSVYAFRLGGPDSRKVAILFEDITQRKRAEERRGFIAALAEQLAPLRDEPAIVRAATHAVGQALRADRCYFVEFEEMQDRVVITENYLRGGSPSLAGPISLQDFGGIQRWQEYTGKALAVDDVTKHAHTRDRPAAYTALGIRAIATQPFLREGTRTAVLVATDTEPRRWTADELKLMEDAMVRVWPLVERARADRALVTAHGALERRVAERTAKLQETISELESYSYSISHDLRAPLRAMQTYASILMTECATQIGGPGREYLRRIMVAAERMDRLIRDVLVYSRVTREEMPLERMELASFIAGVIETYPGLNAAHAEIEVVAPLPAVRANPAALTQCFANLLGNAIKFATPGVMPRIRIWAEADAGRVRVHIRDNGRGIAADAQAKIFGMFYQIDPATEGTGIGLAVVRRAAERMGGSVGVSSTPGEGSTFWLELQAAAGT